MKNPFMLKRSLPGSERSYFVFQFQFLNLVSLPVGNELLQLLLDYSSKPGTYLYLYLICFKGKAEELQFFLDLCVLRIEGIEMNLAPVLLYALYCS